MSKTGVVGHFGEGKKLLNGQTIKTKIITEELIKELGCDEIKKYDTHNWSSNPVSIVLNSLNAFYNCENIVVLPARRGIKVIAPLFTIFNVFFRRKIHYVVIGGWLPKILIDKPVLTKIISKFEGVYVETVSMMKELSNLGLKNIRLFRNFKDLEIIEVNDLKKSYDMPFQLCTFSRVMEEKGIEDAIKIVIEINEAIGYTAYSLDIYGQIDNNYEGRFKEIRESLPDYIQYKGIVEFGDSVSVLKDYFMLLFPTKFETEGIPGTIIDAYAAGVPVIASNWISANEVIIKNKTGFIYEFNKYEEMKDIILKISDNPELIIDMKNNCIKEAQKYLPEAAIKGLLKYLY